MPIAALIALLVQVLPTVADDVAAVTGLLDSTSSAIKNAQAPGSNGMVSAADWQALQAQTSSDLNQLALDLGMTPPA